MQARGSGCFQALRDITAPSALMLQQHSPGLLRQNESIVPRHFGLENRNFHFPSVLVHNVTTEEASFK